MNMTMTMTVEEHNQRKVRSHKLLVLFAMISMFMMFAGLTSAYLVSASRKDWIHTMIVPPAFMISTILIILSSVTMYLAKKMIQKGDREKTTWCLLATLILGLAFVFFQFKGFSQIIEMGYYFTGKGSSVTSSFLYVLTILHLGHLFGGMISLLITIYNHFKQKYTATQFAGIEIAGMFWHFLDILWVYLFLFLYFVK
jgi:cytochrome c oxidase subunit III